MLQNRETGPLPDLDELVSTHSPRRATLWERPDYTPPERLRTPDDRPATVVRSDLKPPLQLSPQDLAKAKRLPSGVAGREVLGDAKRTATIRQPSVMEAVGAKTSATSTPTTPPRGIVFGKTGFRRGITRQRILAFLREAPPGSAWTVSEITVELNKLHPDGPDRGAVASQCYHYQAWMPDVEMRKLIVGSGFMSQYRIQQEAPWPPIPAGARIAAPIQRRAPSGPRRRTARN